MRRLLTGGWLVLTALSGCGYGLAGSHVGLPADVRRIHVGTIGNDSNEHGLDRDLAFALEREIVVRQQLELATAEGEADAVLAGRIRELQLRPVVFNRADRTTEYEIRLLLDFTLTRREDGKVVWQTRGLRLDEDYATSLSAVISSSPEFQQQGLNPEDLRNPQFNPQVQEDPQAPGVQVARASRVEALRRIVRQAARDLYNAMLEDF